MSEPRINNKCFLSINKLPYGTEFSKVVDFAGVGVVAKTMLILFYMRVIQMIKKNYYIYLIMIASPLFFYIGCLNKPEKFIFVETTIHHDTRYKVKYIDERNIERTESLHYSIKTETKDGFLIWYDEKIFVKSPDGKVLFAAKGSTIRWTDFQE